jgi:FAD:protein FMN transferase
VVGLDDPVTPSTTPTDVLRLQESCDAMGTTFSIILYGSNREEMESAISAAFDEVHRLDQLLSNYRPASEWSSVNRHAASGPVRVSAELFHFLSDCVRYSQMSEGAFDITVGPLMKAWGFFHGDGRVPGEEELAEARRRVGYRQVRLNAVDLSVQFEQEGIELDPGGIGKGYAVDRMVDLLKERGFGTALIAGSASSLYGVGIPPGETEGWRADIRHPEHPRKYIAQCLLADTSLTTSGTGDQYFWSEQGMFSHIVDPRTGRALAKVLQVSVMSRSAVEGEVWSKACLINGREWAAAHRPDDMRVLFSSDSPPRWF